MKQKELLECELAKESEKLGMVRFDIITLTSPMMTRSELQQLCDEISRLRSACERLADEIDVVSARKLRLFDCDASLMKQFNCSSSFTSSNVAFKAAASSTTNSPSAALLVAPAVALSHATAAHEQPQSQLYTGTTAQLQRGDAREWPHADDWKLTKSCGRR